MAGSNERIEVEGCDTIPKLFWHQVKQRGERTAFREKDLGIWRATSWREYGERAKAAGMGLVKFGLSHGQVVSVLAETVPEWLYVDMGTHGRGRRQQRHLSDRFGQAGRVHPERQPHPLPVRRERGAARQVPRDPRALPRPGQGLRLRHGGPGRLQRPDGHGVRRAARARPRLRQGQPRAVGEAGRELAGRGAGDPRLHLRHDRAAQGRDAVAPQRHLPAQQRRRLHPDREGRRAARLPAALPRRRAHLHGLPAVALGRHRQLRRERRDGAGQYPGSGTHDVLRRAAHLGALLFRHRHPHEGGDLDRPRRLQVGDRAGAQGGRCRARRAQARAIPEARPRHRRLAGARQHQARHRPASREVRRHRCRADRARPHQVVSRARRRHARGLRPDRELRPRDRHARPHQARHRRRHRAAHRIQDLARGRDPAQGPAHLHGLPEPAREDGRDAARRLAAHRRRRLSSTTRATSRSPTA